MIKKEDENSWLASPPLSPVKDILKTHHAVDAPICIECDNLNLAYLDPECPGCCKIIIDPKTSVSELFAIIRQWVPQVQSKMDMVVAEIFKRGFNVNDRDLLTDMTLLHYVAKSGADGMGDSKKTSQLAHMLIKKGILVNAKCRWTDMSALHYAVFFDVYSVVEIILENGSCNDLDRPCKEYGNGTPLHIGCQNLSYKSVDLLLKKGANPHFLDENGKRPIDCIPQTDAIESTDVKKIAALMKNQVSMAMKNTEPNIKENLNLSILYALGLDLHCRVIIAGKVGILRFAGSTEFASGIWAGIELEEKSGKNNGTVGGVQYFQCKANHGIFAPVTIVKRYDADYLLLSPSPPSSPTQGDNSGSTDNTSMFGLKLGEKVVVAGQKTGFVRYRGPTKFAAGTWVGVELEEPVGKNDGTVGDFRYFKCDGDRGIFAPLSKIQRIEDIIEAAEEIDMPKTVKKYNSKKKIEGEEQKTLFMKVDMTTIQGKDVQDEDSLEKEEKPVDETPKRPNINPRINASVQQLSQPKKSQQRLDKTFGAQVNFTLKTGMSVYVNNTLGIVRYIGRVEFSGGVWLGVELRKPSGKNDGSVEGKRYFTCKPKHGLMTRPGRATCRGINCDQLVDLKFR